jgi:hypothetical protein
MAAELSTSTRSHVNHSGKYSPPPGGLRCIPPGPNHTEFFAQYVFLTRRRKALACSGGLSACLSEEVERTGMMGLTASCWELAPTASRFPAMGPGGTLFALLP